MLYERSCICLFGTCLYTFMLGIYLGVNFACFIGHISIYIYDTAKYLSNVFVPIYTLLSNVRRFQLFQHLVLSAFFWKKKHLKNII